MIIIYNKNGSDSIPTLQELMNFAKEKSMLMETIEYNGNKVENPSGIKCSFVYFNLLKRFASFIFIKFVNMQM